MLLVGERPQANGLDPRGSGVAVGAVVDDPVAGRLDVGLRLEKAPLSRRAARPRLISMAQQPPSGRSSNKSISAPAAVR
jgi:hypothetical protein